MHKLHLYAGIGSRRTPPHVCQTMTMLARQLSSEWKLRSGHADGADLAFERGAPIDRKEIHLPWDGYNNAPLDKAPYVVPRPLLPLTNVAADHHPMWDEKRDDGTPVLSTGVKLLLTRNASILLGINIDQPVRMVVCWTPGASEVIGGTSHAIRIAKTFNIPVFNLARPADQDKLIEFVKKL
jgi:hypothetical protein